MEYCFYKNETKKNCSDYGNVSIYDLRVINRNISPGASDKFRSIISSRLITRATLMRVDFNESKHQNDLICIPVSGGIAAGSVRGTPRTCRKKCTKN